MLTAIRSFTTRRLGALISVAALAAAVPATAMAEHRDERRGWSVRHDHRGRDHHGHHARDDRGDHGRGHRGHHSSCSRDHGHGHGPSRFHGFWHRPYTARGVHHYGAAPAYACRPCGLHFGSYDGLTGHVHHHHHVAGWRIPGLISQVSFGFAFGY